MRADLHVHLGSALGRRVKMGASFRLSLPQLAQDPSVWAGMDVLGVVDCQVFGPLEELEGLLSAGEIRQLPGGGFSFPGGLLVAGAEMQVEGFHAVAFVPDLEALRALSRHYLRSVSNPRLSTGAVRTSGRALAREVSAMGGVLVPAHVFTPFRGLLGRGQDLAGVLGAQPPLVELGLSADTSMAHRLAALQNSVFLTNSDAHSPERIGREHNLLAGSPGDFTSLLDLLIRGKVAANYGLDPRLGKYFRSLCRRCGFDASGRREAVLACPACGQGPLVRGVWDRAEIMEKVDRPRSRPPYVHQVPLSTLPGIGPQTRGLLLKELGSEHRVLHEADLSEVEMAGGIRARRAVDGFRQGQLSFREGGGGRYGSIIRCSSGA